MLTFVEYINERSNVKLPPRLQHQVDVAEEHFLDKLGRMVKDPNTSMYNVAYYLYTIYENKNRALGALLKEGMRAQDIMNIIFTYFDSDSLSEKDKKYKLKLMGWIYDIVSRHVDDIEPIDLEI